MNIADLPFVTSCDTVTVQLLMNAVVFFGTLTVLPLIENALSPLVILYINAVPAGLFVLTKLATFTVFASAVMLLES